MFAKIEPPKWVMAILALVLIARIPTFFEPYFYGDEMIYLTLGNAIRKGLTLYSQIHDNKPPLLYLTAAVAGNLFWFKAILAFWMIATIIVFWHLTKTLFKDVRAQQVSVVVFAILTTIPLFEGNIVNAELFLIGPIILGITLLLKKGTNLNIFLAGIAFSVATLFKVPAAFDIPVIVLFWLITLKDVKNLPEIIKKTIILGVGFAIPIFATLIWYFFKGALPAYINAAFLQNIGYISSWSGQKQSFLLKHGPLLTRAAVVLIGLVLLKLNSKKLSTPFLISSIWLLTSLFAVTLSERPYPHYMIQAIPSISLLIGILVASIKFEQVLVVFPLTLAILVPVYYKFYYYPTAPYYLRFIKFANHQISKWQYMNDFNKTTQGNYEISSSIQNRTSENDKIFVWGEDAPVVYALSRRLPPIKYVADYHITDFSSLDAEAKNLSNKPPKLIVILPNSPKYPALQNLLIKKYAIELQNSNAEIWHLVAN